MLCGYVAGLVSCPLGPLIIRQLQRKEDECRAANPSWVTDVPDDLRQQWHEAQANRRMQFKVGNFKFSEIRMLTGTLKADWIQLPLESYLAMFPTLKRGGRLWSLHTERLRGPNKQ